KTLATMSSETPPIPLTNSGVWAENGSMMTVTKKDLQAISEELRHLLSAAPAALCCLGQCLAIAESDDVGEITQGSDSKLYVRAGLPVALDWSCANSVLLDPSLCIGTSSNV